RDGESGICGGGGVEKYEIGC
ncbi:hypothetical protein L195_g062908, partial [Trifolium pratense]